MSRIRKEIDSVIESYISGIKYKVSGLLDKVFEEYLGVKRRGGVYGATTISTHSPIYKAFTLKAEPIIQELVESIEWKLTDEELVEIHKAMKERFVKHILDNAQDEARKAANDKLRRYLKEEMSLDIETEGLKPIEFPTTEELSNPEYGETELEKAIIGVSLKEDQDESL